MGVIREEERKRRFDRSTKERRMKGEKLVKMAIDTDGRACYNSANQISQLKDRGAVVKSSPGVRSLRDRCRRGKGPLPKADMQDSPGQTNKIRLTVAFAESYGLIAECCPTAGLPPGAGQDADSLFIAADAAGVGCFCFPAEKAGGEGRPWLPGFGAPSFWKSGRPGALLPTPFSAFRTAACRFALR